MTSKLTLRENELHMKSIVSNMLDFTQKLVVNTEESYRKITSLYRDAREWKKRIEAKRKEMSDPFRKKLAAINDKAKELTDPLDKVIEISNIKADGYRRILEELKLQEEQRLRTAASVFDSDEEIYVFPVDPVIRGDGAISVTKTEKKFNVVDLDKVPLKYLMVNEKAIEQDLKLGVSEIPGLEIYETTTTKLRVR